MPVIGLVPFWGIQCYHCELYFFRSELWAFSEFRCDVFWKDNHGSFRSRSQFGFGINACVLLGCFQGSLCAMDRCWVSAYQFEKTFLVFIVEVVLASSSRSAFKHCFCACRGVVCWVDAGGTSPVGIVCCSFCTLAQRISSAVCCLICGRVGRTNVYWGIVGLSVFLWCLSVHLSI